MSLTRPAAIASLLLFSCAPRPRAPVVVETPRAKVEAKTETAPGWLVWTHRDDGTMHTALVDGAGDTMSEAAAAVLSADGALLAIARKHRTFELGACGDGMGEGLGPSFDEQLSLVRLDGDEAVRPIVRGTSSGDDSADVGVVRVSLDVVGSVGPYLYTRDNVWSYACGAHGMWFQTSRVVDVRTGSDVLVRPEDLRQASRAAHDKFVAMAEKDEIVATLWEKGDPGELQYTALEPRFDGARFTFVHVFLADAPYAFGNTMWRSYAVEAEVPAVAPRELHDALELPAPVRVYASRLGKDDHFGGFSPTADAQSTAHAMADAPRIAPRPAT